MYRMKHTTRAASLAALLTASAATVHAQDPVYPLTLPVSGTLTDAEDKPLTGNHEIELRLYGAATGSDILWAEAFEVEGPLLAVLLGKTTRPLEQRAPLKELVTKGEVTHLEILIDGEVQRPRLGLGAVPYAVAAEQANLALRAVEAGDAASLNGKTAADFISSSYKPTYQELADKPAFAANGPLHLDVQGANHVFSLSPCAADRQTLSWTQAGWGCATLPTPLIGSTTIEILQGAAHVAEDSLTSFHIAGRGIDGDDIALNTITRAHIRDAEIVADKIGNNAVENRHIAANTLLPNKIAGGAVTLVSNTAQLIMNTMTIAQGAVTITGSLTASSYATTNPVRRTYRLWPDQFKALPQANIPEVALTSDNHLYLLTAPAAAPSPFRVTLLSSISDLPEDAQLDALRCYYIQGNGSTSGSSFKLVSTGYNSTAITRKEETITLGSAPLSGNIRTVSQVVSAANRSMIDRRLHVEVLWQTSMLGTWNRFVGCEIDVLSSHPF